MKGSARWLWQISSDKLGPGPYGIGGRIPPARLKQVFDNIEAHLDQQTHLSDLAETASMSPFYFARIFKNSVGVSPHKYVTTRRIERAKELLNGQA